MRVRAISWTRFDSWPTLGHMRSIAPVVVDFGGRTALIIPSGFWSDGASVPRIAAALMPTALHLLRVGFIHDFASRRGSCIQRPGRSEPIPLGLATDIALAVAQFDGVGWVRRTAIGAALTVAAPTYWQRKDVQWAPSAR